MKLSLLSAGTCVHPEHVALRTRTLRTMTFPAMFALVEHPTHGITLFDTGYGEAFLHATRRFPERLHRWVTPVSFDPSQSARAVLARRGIRAQDVDRIIVSHFHGDHIGGLLDFPDAEILYGAGAPAGLGRMSRFEGLRLGFMVEMLPRDFDARAKAITGPRVPLPPECAPFTEGIDLFGDRSVVVVELPGHAAGQVGLYLETDDRPFLLVADACWDSRSYRGPILPHPLTKLIIDDFDTYAATIQQLHELGRREGELVIVPSHCAETLARHGSS